MGFLQDAGSTVGWGWQEQLEVQRSRRGGVGRIEGGSQTDPSSLLGSCGVRGRGAGGS